VQKYSDDGERLLQTTHVAIDESVALFAFGIESSSQTKAVFCILQTIHVHVYIAADSGILIHVSIYLSIHLSIYLQRHINPPRSLVPRRLSSLSKNAAVKLTFLMCFLVSDVAAAPRSSYVPFAFASPPVVDSAFV
jgi:hypothetical protein